MGELKIGVKDLYLKGLTIFHLNIRSLLYKLDQVKLIKSIDIICITETWLHNNISNHELTIQGYKLGGWQIEAFIKHYQMEGCNWCLIKVIRGPPLKMLDAAKTGLSRSPACWSISQREHFVLPIPICWYSKTSQTLSVLPRTQLSC